MNESAKLCPIQFIEGINENEESTSGKFLTWGEYGISIPYTPSITYRLARIEVYGSPKHLPEQKEHAVRLYTDHKDNPGKTSVVEGKLIIPSASGEQWLSIELAQSIVVFAEHKYWLSIVGYPLLFAVGIATDGVELSLRGYLNQRWTSSSSDRRYRCMLRFFGRVLPTN